MALRVLIVEGDSEFASRIQGRFEELGADVSVFSDGDSAVEHAARFVPGIVFVSVELPNANGFLICKSLKKDPQLRSVPVVMLSGDAKADEIFAQHKQLRTKADGYIRKPVSFESLMEQIEDLVPSDAFEEQGLSESMDDIEEEVIIENDDEEPMEANVDDEIDQFTENAFDALVIDDAKTSVANFPPGFGKGRTQEKEVTTSPAAQTSPERARKSSIPPPLPSAKSVPPAASVEPSMNRQERALRAELDDLRHQLEEATRKSGDAEKLERELRELKAKPAAKGAAGGISSREFLDLREALNLKDKEILELRDQISARDKQLLEARDKSLQLERKLADLEDKNQDTQDQLDTMTQRAESLQADKEAVTKRADDLKARLERTEGKAQKFEKELEAESIARAADIARLEKERDDTVSALKHKHEEESARASGQHAIEVQTQKEKHQSEMEGVRSEHALEVSELKDAHRESIRQLKEAHEHIEKESAEKHSMEIAALSRAHESEKTELRADAEQEKQNALDKQRAELTLDKEHALDKAEARREKDLADAKVERDQSLALLEQELEEKSAREIKAAQDKHSQELAVLGRKLAETEGLYTSTQESLERSQQEAARLKQDLEERTEERDRHNKDLASARKNIHELERDLKHARAKLEDDEETLERARKAFAIGLTLLDEQKTNELQR